MKRKSLFFAVALLALSSVAFFSCDDDSDNNLGTGNEEVQVTTNAHAEALTNALYGPLQKLSSSYSFLVESATETTISFEEVDDSKDGPQVSVFETTESNWYPIKIFNQLYTSIGAANLAIERIGAAETSKELTDSVKNLNIARAKFIRGYNYFQLVQLFGEVPLILTTSSAETARASIDDVYTRIVTDLTEAYPILPNFSADKSKPSQGAANAILAKVYLTWGQKPLTQAEVEAIKTSTTDPVKPAVDAAKLQKAIDYANAVINSGKYKLLDDFNNIWGVGNENNDEVIFSIHHDGDGIDAQGNHQTHCGFTWPKSERTDPHISYADISFENKISDPADTRKLYSYVTSVEYKNGEKDTLTWPLSIVRPGKWIHRSIEGTNIAVDNQPNNIDHIDFRYAEVLLVKAEALFFLERASDALPVINEIRIRAGVSSLTALTKESLYTEWQNELAFEQKHWLNLVRWRTLISAVKDNVPKYEYYKSQYASASAIKAAFPEVANIVNAAFYARVYKHLHAKVDHINGHFYRFPIPLSESFTDLGITPQNPGY
jgi:hypothetical protein